jgi:hypothetical protein
LKFEQGPKNPPRYKPRELTIWEKKTCWKIIDSHPFMDDFLEKKHVDVPFAKPCSGHMLALLAVVNSENASGH